jgi:NAD(P)H dehydrogenase (quinone)
MPTMLISYFSKSGHTKKMAEAIAKGAKEEGCDVVVKDVLKTSGGDLRGADAVVIGSPTYYGTMAAEVKKLLDESVKDHGKLSGKIGGAFASSGMIGGGNETTILSIIQALLIHGMVVLGNSDIGHYGPVAIGAPDERAIKECVKYGKRLADLTTRLAK